MKISAISFTRQGQMLAERIRERMGGEDVMMLYTKCSVQNAECLQTENDRKNSNAIAVTTSLSEWAEEQMTAHHALLFIGACGIAVRAIAPQITDKLHDSPVLVMDEQGQHVIPLLSGHVGGANEIALRISQATGAIPVITTATDLHGSFAVDLFAKRNDLRICNREGIAKVSAKVLARREITMCVRTGHLEISENLPDGIRLCEYPPAKTVDVLVEDATPSGTQYNAQLILQPKKYILGVGCKKGTDNTRLEDYLQSVLEWEGISIDQIAAMASIDVKKQEACLLEFSEKHRIPFRTYSAQELQAVPGEFHTSSFVKNTVGVDNVCERAAICAAGDGGRLVLDKHAEDGMTVAIAEREWKVNFHEQ